MIRLENPAKLWRFRRAVHHISLDVDQGETFAFLGPNGAGKTSTIKMLTMLLEPTSGRIELDGMDP
jgi:ABC-2 type transport system ATP-binding protein